MIDETLKKRDITLIQSCDSMHTWLLTQSRFINMISSLIARRGSVLTLNDSPGVKLSLVSWCHVLDFSWAHSDTT